MQIHRSNMLRVYVWAGLFVACWSQRAEQLLAQNPCSSKVLCSECIQTSGCSWCYASDFNGPRCFNPVLTGGTGGCNEAYIFNPDNERIVDPKYNRELSKANGRISAASSSSFGSSSAIGSSSFGSSGAAAGSEEQLVQIQPQRVQLKLRMNQMQKLSFSYSLAQDYPVDLYYLMDLSRSMKNDKEKLSTLGNLLSTTMRNMTSNFKIGFGSFVDKLVLPYVSTVPKNLIQPCDGCAAPYGYRNQMSLSKDTDFFEQAVTKAEVSGNLDAPEGGFDAIMQAVVCKQEIGWRDQARRLLVFSTDAEFHYAGDGKLGGIVEPNDGKCHMENNSYTHSTLQDYPSISQINLKVKENDINVIFAVTSDYVHMYEQLSQHIQGSSSGILSDDSDNVVDLVRDQYNKITSEVEMKDTSNDALHIAYYSKCLGNELMQTNKCGGLKVGHVVDFTAEITLRECPKDRSQWKQMFKIAPVGLGISDNLVVDLEMICDCPCEHPGHYGYDDNQQVCSGYGVSKCGVCECNSGRFGKKCECSATSGGSEEQDRSCRPNNATSGLKCSGRGTCLCGVCECDNKDPTKVVSGPFCECDNFSCDMYRGQLCSGAEHGECVCGKCSCRPEYTGPACQCLRDTAPCHSPDGKICSGHGKCSCGQCVCDVEGDQHYSGKFCDKCPTCLERCEKFKDCVLCEVHKRGPNFNATTSTCDECSLFPIIEEGNVEANETLNEHLCSFYDDEDCLYVYVYSYNDTQQLVIRAQKDRECPRKVPILGIVLGVIAAIVLVGLAVLMLWKMATTIHDRREFARFEKQRMMAKWDTGENPIYKQATSTFKNPTYAGK